MPRPAVLAVVLLAGCSAAPPPVGEAGSKRAAELHEVGQLLALYSGETGRGAGKAADLAKFEAVGPVGYRAVQAGEVVVVWGAKMPGEGDAPAAPADVIAYEKDAGSAGGWVLLQNATVRQMTAAEFQAAPRAK